MRNIANFGKVSFNFRSTFNQSSPMLNVVGGAATDLNWDAIAYTGTAPVGRSILMQNMSNINLGATYMGAKLASLTDTHERVIDTNTGTGTAQQIYLDGYQFKSANVTPTTGSATEDVWAGRSVIGNTTTENTLTLNGSTTHQDAYGGWTAGTGTGRTPCWVRTRPWPSASGPTIACVISRSSRQTAAATTSTMESTAPASWK